MSSTSGSLPRSHLASTAAILVLSIVSSLLGLFRPNHYTDPPVLLARTQVEDVMILVVAVPALAIGVWYASQGSMRGRVVWLGALAYMTYLWLSRAGLLAFNDFFLGYVALFSLSLFTLIGGVVTTNPEPIDSRLDGRLSRPVYDGVLILTSIGLSLLWLSDIVPAILAGTTPLGIQEFGPKGALTYVFDLGLLVPSYVLGAYLLWTRHRWGYATTGILLIVAALFAPTLSALTVVDFQQGVEMTPGIIAGTILPPLIPGLFAIKYLIALDRPGTGSDITEYGVES